MPETSLVAPLIAGARAREAEMIERSGTAMPAPGGQRSRRPGRRSATRRAGCTRCDLYKCATQTVFGEGPLDATILFVGEQPGDQEDLAGRPFVGPAGQVFDAALEEAGIDRAQTYVTNAVKHFKFVLRGKRRIHQKPGAGEIERLPLVGRAGARADPPAADRRARRNRGAEPVRQGRGDQPRTAASRYRLPTAANAGSPSTRASCCAFPSTTAAAEERSKFVDDLKRIRDRAEELAA